MQIKNISVIFGYSGSNTYVIRDEKICVVDPGFTPDFGINLDDVSVVVNTHGHFDHTKNDYLFKNAEIYAHEADLPMINEGRHACAEFYGEQPVKVAAKKIPGVLSFGKTSWQVIHTPGHSAGSICLYEKNLETLISGDLCFADGIGRTDLFGGNAAELTDSLKKIAKLKVTQLLPGHGKLGTGESIRNALRELNAEGIL